MLQLFLFISIIGIVFYLIWMKIKSNAFVKIVDSVFDEDIIRIDYHEYCNIVDDDQAMNVVVLYSYQNGPWMLVNDRDNLKAITEIDNFGNVKIRMNGAPIDPAASVKIIIK